jgi:hypothetical protein
VIVDWGRDCQQFPTHVQPLVCAQLVGCQNGCNHLLGTAQSLGPATRHCSVVAATALARRPLFFCSCPASNLDQPRCRCICSAFLSQHTLWLIYRLHAPYRCSSLTASRSFDAGGIAYLRTNILRRSKHPLPDFCAETSTNAGGTPTTRHLPTRHDQAANRSKRYPR